MRYLIILASVLAVGLRVGGDRAALADLLPALEEHGVDPAELSAGYQMLERTADRCGILFTCSRGYARDMVHAVLDAGHELGLKPAGEEVFNRWINGMSNVD